VNIDHVATIRQARGGKEPDPVWAAALAELGGADGITVHLREDRRHIQDRDVRLLRETVKVRLNLESSVVPEMVAIACELGPDQVTIVPERRAEVTTEGGLDVISQRHRVAEAIAQLRSAGIETSLFIDPDPDQVEASVQLGAAAIELHTGRYADARRGQAQARELSAIVQCGTLAVARGIALHAGHGLNYENVGPIAAIEGMAELNIGHSLVSRAVFVGMERAVREMKECMERARMGRSV
jgi:pyridoxine 5-phosphate synthase